MDDWVWGLWGKGVGFCGWVGVVVGVIDFVGGGGGVRG